MFRTCQNLPVNPTYGQIGAPSQSNWQLQLADHEVESDSTPAFDFGVLKKRCFF